MEHICGVYQIQNTINGKVYVGSAVNIARRWGMHKWYLMKKRHDNKHLQAAWYKYGESSFVFSLVEKTSKKLLKSREQFWITKKDANNEVAGYNIEKVVGNPMQGRHHTKRTIEKMRKQKIGRKNPMYGKPAWNTNLTKKDDPRVAKLGLGPNSTHFKKGERPSPKTEFKKGLQHSNEWKEKMSIRMSGKNNPSYGHPSPMKGIPKSKWREKP